MSEKMMTTILVNQILMMKVMSQLLQAPGVTAHPTKETNLHKELDSAAEATRKLLWSATYD